MKSVLWGDWQVNIDTRRLTRGVEERRVSPKAIAVLRALDSAPDRILSRSVLLDIVWPNVTVGEEVLTHAIAELRRAVGDDTRTPRYIETVHKHGYRLTAPLRSVVAPVTPIVRGPDVSGPASDAILHDLDDYALLLTATQRFERGGRRNLEDAARAFTHLTRRQPNSATAHAGLARSLAVLDLYFGQGQSGIAEALRASERAVRINRYSPEAQAARGIAFAQAGKVHASRTHFQKAIRLRPDAAETHRLLGHASFNWGDFSLSAVMMEQAARLQPDDFHSLILAAKMRGGVNDGAAMKRNVALAIPRIETHVLAYPEDFRVRCGKARALVELGHLDAALEVAEDLVRHPEPMDYYFACMLARAGEVGLAIDRLEACAETGWRNGPLLGRDPDFASLRAEPRFRKLATLLEAA